MRAQLAESAAQHFKTLEPELVKQQEHIASRLDEGSSGELTDSLKAEVEAAWKAKRDTIEALKSQIAVLEGHLQQEQEVAGKGVL